MSELRKILGTSSLSLMLVIWGLFTVCSGRVPDVDYDDDFAADDSEFQGNESDDIMTQLAMLDDDESTKLEDFQRNEILEALGIEPSGSEISRKEEEDFLSEELFLDLEVEIAELEKMNSQKRALADSLKDEVQEADFRLTALNRVVGDTPGARSTFTGATRSAPSVNRGAINSQYTDGYQSALDDVYARRFNEAISKFRDLLVQMDTRDNLADNCQYWIGEAYYASGNYDLAAAEFEKVFAFDDANKADDAQFMIGLSAIKIGDSGLAQAELRSLMTFYQESEYVARAEREFSGLNM